MDENSENIISVCNGNKEIADEAFVELMSLTEKCLNDKAKSNQDKYKNCGGKAMENEAAKAMIEVAPSTPFRNAKIEVVSGARFPDIQAGVYYGVEVKTTKGNKWKSVGSSIVESTRIKEVSMIYMLFGKLGGEFAEFRCKPYEDCLDNISLTHQPRYQIDMELEEKQQATIFQKMKTDYNAFRLYDEKEKIQKVRQYFRSTAKEGKEMSWWLGMEDENDNWNEGLDREWSKDMHLIYPFHNLYDNCFFSLYDLVYVREFNLEVHCIYRCFNCLFYFIHC